MNILIGITGSNAALKSSKIIKDLKEYGHKITVITTKNCEVFAIENEIKAIKDVNYIENTQQENQKILNFEQLNKNDLILIVPASYNFIAKYANKIGDNLLLQVINEFDGKVMLCPAMNKAMWNNPILQENIKKLENTQIINPRIGLLSSGQIGIGLLEEEEIIVQIVQDYVKNQKLGK